MKYDGPFEAVNLKGMLELSLMLDQKEDLSLEDKYMLSNAPINTRSPLILSGYKKYVNAILTHSVTKFRLSSKITGIARTQLELLQAEDEVKKISLYLWLSYKLPELFPDKQKAELCRVEINNFCENSLKSNKRLKPMENRSRNRNDGNNRFQKDRYADKPRRYNKSYNDRDNRARNKYKDSDNKASSEEKKDSPKESRRPRRRRRNQS